MKEQTDLLTPNGVRENASGVNREQIRLFNTHGRIFVLDHDTNRNGRIDFEDLEWEYLKGDGDFRSEEVCGLRDEADVIVTNPPFSLFREFLSWILDGKNCLARRRGGAVVGSCVPRDRDGNALATKNTKAANRGVFEYVLGGEEDTKLLNVRVFDRRTAKAVYARQTEDARSRGVSNCPLCAVGHEANATRVWTFGEMDADHVAAWSKGGATDAANCQMFCKTHNRAKGNR